MKRMLLFCVITSSMAFAEPELKKINFFFECKALPHSFKFYNSDDGINVIASDGSYKESIKNINYTWSGTGNCSHRTFDFIFDEQSISVSEQGCSSDDYEGYNIANGSVRFGQSNTFWCISENLVTNEHSGLCQNARSNLEINICLNEEKLKAQEAYKKYAEEVRRIHYQTLPESFKNSFETRINEFNTYAESKCSAKYEYSRGFTKAPTDYAYCMIDLHKRETLDLWTDFIERNETNLVAPEG